MNRGTDTPIQDFGLLIHLELFLTQDRAKGNQQNRAGEN